MASSVDRWKLAVTVTAATSEAQSALLLAVTNGNQMERDGWHSHYNDGLVWRYLNGLFFCCDGGFDCACFTCGQVKIGYKINHEGTKEVS